MKKLTKLAISFILALVIFFVSILYFRLSIEVSIVITSFALIVIGGISIIGFDEFMKLFEGKPKTEGMTQEQIRAYEEEQVRLKAREDFKEGEKERKYTLWL
jgi:hypothetical protein